MRKPSPDWVNILFLCLTPLVGLGGTAWYAATQGIVWWEPTLCLTLFFAVGLSIGSGYHRYFSHRAYECHPAVESVMLFFGAMALQNSVLQWARDHREHHRFVDTDRDPYNIKRGGLWAHMLWIFYKEGPEKNFDAVPDLLRNPRVMWQHRWAREIGILFGLGFPTLVGAFFGRPLGGLLWGGFLRIVLVHHTTFFINSLAHMWGIRPYSTENSARDNWFLAFFTHGEGFHNFHHAFPSDFRNGIRWYHWDPEQVDDRGAEAHGPRAQSPEDAGAAHREGALARSRGRFGPRDPRRRRLSPPYSRPIFRRSATKRGSARSASKRGWTFSQTSVESCSSYARSSHSSAASRSPSRA